MKKLLFVIFSTFMLFSCSNDNSSPTNSTTVQRVLFYRNSPNEKQWNFTNNLLTSITLHDGSVAEEFIYNDQNQVISDLKYTNGILTETNTIVYNSNGTIASINGLAYIYDAATQTYSYTYSSDFSLICHVNSDFLATDYSRMGTDPKEYHMTYTDGNMMSFEKTTNGTTEVLKNFHFDSTLGSNPITNAVLPVAQVKSLLDPEFFVDSQTSEFIPIGFDRGVSDPYYYNYGLVVGENHYFALGIEVIDDNNNDVNFIQYAEYYYQN